MSKKKISVSQTLKIDEVFKEKGWGVNDSLQPFLYDNYVHRISILPEDTKDLFLELTCRFDNISSVPKILNLFREGYKQLDRTKIDNARKIYFLPLIVPELGYENKSKYRIINEILKFLGLNKKIYNERPERKSCDKMISLFEIEYRDMYSSHKFVFPEKYSIFKTQFDRTKDLVILIDDFIGTGETAEEVLDFFIKKEKFNYKSVSVLTLVSQSNGIFLLKEKYNVDVLTGIIQDTSITSYYGEEAEFKRQIVEKMSKSINIKKDFFGYKDSEALVCILNKSPNNTLPIFWHETKSNPAPFPRRKIYNNQIYEE